MRAILLAAGKGTRLERGAGERAKCLLKLGELTIIERQIFYLRQSDIEDIVVVVGFQSQQVRQVCGAGVQYIENPIYQETNSLYSLWLARHFFLDGFVVMNTDVFFHPQLLLDLLTARYEDALLVGYREDNSYGDEEMKVKISRNGSEPGRWRECGHREIRGLRGTNTDRTTGYPYQRWWIAKLGAQGISTLCETTSLACNRNAGLSMD